MINFPTKEETRPAVVRSSSNSTDSSSEASSTSTAATDYYGIEDGPILSNFKDTREVTSCPNLNYNTHQPKPHAEFQRIRQACPVLASTSCTKEFCQAGRMMHTEEPRVGRDRPLAEMQREAAGFLLECRKAGVITTDAALEVRLRAAAKEINDSATSTSMVTEAGTKDTGMTGGNWVLERDELLYGVRAAWRNSKRCIMRSQHRELELCDLRHVHKSKEMGEALVRGMTDAFKNGSIQPTAFIFPPRVTRKTGPMIWNGQILAFAGYRQQDGTILGDPANADLTEAIIELGWNPPETHTRTKWDLLPLVTMAEDDDAAITELPIELQQVVKISHPRYTREFQDLDMRWVAFPALSRLGFDIGGVQFTATPFIGWFMDAEIGVRNLADSFRYNMLPRIAKALEASNDPDWDIDNFPEFERLAMLSRAQTELNYAVTWSFMKAKVMISDSLTASAKYTQYDDDYFRENGYRLPADPYWLAPPIGSLIPIWHRGGAPNYQPRPLIARHVQDPVKAWRRKRPASWANKYGFQLSEICSKAVVCPKILDERLLQLSRISIQKETTTVRIHFCSSGITAAKLAAKLHSRVASLISKFPEVGTVQKPLPLNQLELSQLQEDDVAIVITSTTGRGEMPANGAKFVKSNFSANDLKRNVFFTIFGNGNSTYGDTYNAATLQTQNLLQQAGMEPVAGGVFEGDSSIENPPWKDFNNWWERVRDALLMEDKTKEQEKIYTKKPNKTLARNLHLALLENSVPKSCGIVKVSLNIGYKEYHEMDHVRVFPPNQPARVDRALDLLDLSGELDVEVYETSFKLSQYLTEYADVEVPFKTLDWLAKIPEIDRSLARSLRSKCVMEVLESLRRLNCKFERVISEICADMTIIAPRVFSTASSMQFIASGGNVVDLLVKVNPGGAFSDTFLSHAQKGAALRYSISPFPARDMFFSSTLKDQLSTPILAIATGSGIGPIRSLLQQRVAAISKLSKPHSHTDPSISLFVGYKPKDAAVINEVIASAQDFGGILDHVELVPSNKHKLRVQDRLLDNTLGIREAVKKRLKHPRTIVFICTGEAAATDINLALDTLVKEIQKEEGKASSVDVKEWMGNRYVEEVFRH